MRDNRDGHAIVGAANVADGTWGTRRTDEPEPVVIRAQAGGIEARAHACIAWLAEGMPWLSDVFHTLVAVRAPWPMCSPSDEVFAYYGVFARYRATCGLPCRRRSIRRCAHCWHHPRDLRSYPAHPDGQPYAWISNLMTDPAWRGRGWDVRCRQRDSTISTSAGRGRSHWVSMVEIPFHLSCTQWLASQP